jgi:hypothetical protein
VIVGVWRSCSPCITGVAANDAVTVAQLNAAIAATAAT